MSASNLMATFRGVLAFQRGEHVEPAELFGQLVDLQREAIAGISVLGDLHSLAGSGDAPHLLQPVLIEGMAHLTALLSALAYESTNWLESVAAGLPMEGSHHA